MRGLARFVRARPLLELAVLLVGIVIVQRIALVGPSDLDYVVVTATVYLTIVVGLFVFVGNSGIVSLGQMAYAMVGGYTTALLSQGSDVKATLMPNMPHFIQSASTSPTIALLVGGLAASIVASVVVFPLMRLKGLTASLATFAVLNVVYVVCDNWANVTNASQSLSGIPLVTTANSSLVWALLAVAVAFFFSRSWLGLRLRASREDELAARGIGIHAETERRIAYVLSAFIVAIGGGELALLLSSITPDVFYLDLTFMTLVMLVVGGIGRLEGAVLGTIVVAAAAEILRRAETGSVLGLVHYGGRAGLRDMGLAALTVAILLWRPAGLVGGGFQALFQARLRRRGTDAEPVDEQGPIEALPVVAVPVQDQSTTGRE